MSRTLLSFLSGNSPLKASISSVTRSQSSSWLLQYSVAFQYTAGSASSQSAQLSAPSPSSSVSPSPATVPASQSLSRPSHSSVLPGKLSLLASSQSSPPQAKESAASPSSACKQHPSPYFAHCCRCPAALDRAWNRRKGQYRCSVRTLHEWLLSLA